MGDDDRRITLDELKGACGKFKSHPLVGAKMLGMPSAYGNAESIFKEMDADGKGLVLLNEWCAWLEEQESKNGTKFGKLLLKGENDLIKRIVKNRKYHVLFDSLCNCKSSFLVF